MKLLTVNTILQLLKWKIKQQTNKQTNKQNAVGYNLLCNQLKDKTLTLGNCDLSDLETKDNTYW